MTNTEIAPEVLAQKILDQIESQPEAFDMDWWVTSNVGRMVVAPEDDLCGTTMCVAGWACHIAGYTLRNAPAGSVAVSAAGNVTSVRWAAMNLLGLGDVDDDLFFTDEATAKKCLRRIAAGERFDDLLMALEDR